MIITLIGIQTICVATATGYVISHFKSKFPKVKVYSKGNGFKHYKTF